jgi:putative transposase
MREQALSHIGQVASLADIEQKLRTWLARFYQDAPHAGILGRAPAAVFAEGEKVRVDKEQLKSALTVRTRRRVRRDSTLSLGGVLYEVPFGYLAGQLVTVATCFFESTTPVLELDGKTAPLRVVDPTANAKKRRPAKRPSPGRANGPVDFNPGRTLDKEDDDGDIF